MIVCRLGREAFQKWRSGVIYIVEVLERMLTLAANCLSMIALEEKKRKREWRERLDVLVEMK